MNNLVSLDEAIIKRLKTGDSNALEKLPYIIRHNGLANTFAYLEKDKALLKHLKEEVEKYSSQDALFITRQLYTHAIYLRRISKTMK